jgi:hypothetical protein
VGHTGEKDIASLSTGLVDAGCLIWTRVLVYFAVGDVLLLDDARGSPLGEEGVDDPLPNIVVHGQAPEDDAETRGRGSSLSDSRINLVFRHSQEHSLFDTCQPGNTLDI